MNKKYQKISEEVIHKNAWWSYKHDQYKCDEKDHDYYYGETNGNAIIVPILDDGRIVLIRQYRYLQDRSGVEFPMGGISAGETPLQAAIRELREETGYESTNFSKVGEFEPIQGLAKDKSSVFLANEISSQVASSLDDAEDIELVLRRPDEINEMIKRGEIWSGQTLATWTLVRDFFNVNKN
ncbi:MAG: NUDIX hydrolase [Candidatus Magasanikbacteria bacterium]